MANNEWLYSKGDDHQAGPVSAGELKRLAQSGELAPDDLVWKPGMQEWLPASRIKGITFSAHAPQPAPSPPSPSASPSPNVFDTIALKSTLADAQRRANEAAGVLWFLDLKFQRFVSTTIIRLVWTAYLALGLIGLAANIVRSIFRYPIFEAFFWSLGSILLFFLVTLMFRAFLEALMVVFRISEELHEINEKMALK